jgi:hypothetical protein
MQPCDRGWTRSPDIAVIIQRGIARFAAVYPWANIYPAVNPEQDLGYLLLTATELLTLHPSIPASMHPACGHNDGPSWAECVGIATDNPALYFAGFLMPPARADEGIDLDAVYVPQPDPGDRYYTRAITRPDGAICPPDEDGIEPIDGRPYRRLWWD